MRSTESRASPTSRPASRTRRVSLTLLDVAVWHWAAFIAAVPLAAERLLLPAP